MRGQEIVDRRQVSVRRRQAAGEGDEEALSTVPASGASLPAASSASQIQASSARLVHSSSAKLVHRPGSNAA